MEHCPLCNHPYEGHEGIFVDEESRTLIIDGKLIGLTHRMSQILAGILSCDPRVASIGYLMDYVYGADADDEPEKKILSVYVCRIRKKLKNTRFDIITIWGYGYRIMEIDDGTER